MDQGPWTTPEIKVMGYIANFLDDPAELVVVPLALNASISLKDLVVESNRDRVVGIRHSKFRA
jgi:hypothetical protein